jgi:hypothetical protein
VAAEFPAVAGSAWSLLGGPSDAAPNVSLADVTLKTAGELLYAHLLLFRLLYMT